MQARWRCGKAPQDTKFFSLTLKQQFLLTTPNYTRSFRRLLIRSLFSKTTQLSNWRHTLAMSLGIQKCKTLNISSKKLLSNREYHIDGTLLTTASETIDLGITITDNLQWSQPINQIFLRANHTLINKPYFANCCSENELALLPQTDGWRHEFAIVNNNTNQIVACSNQPGSIYLFSSSRIQTADAKALFGVVCNCVLECSKLKTL